MNDKELSELLDKLRSYIEKDGRVPPELFYFIAQCFGECCLELVIFTYVEHMPHIFLLPREPDDPIWGGMLHVPGVRKLVSDSDTSVLYRVISESGLDISTGDIRYVNSKIIKNERGTEFSDLRYVEYLGKNLKNFYPLSNLPPNIIPFQLPMIHECYKRLSGENNDLSYYHPPLQ